MGNERCKNRMTSNKVKIFLNSCDICESKEKNIRTAQ